MIVHELPDTFKSLLLNVGDFMWVGWQQCLDVNRRLRTIMIECVYCQNGVFLFEVAYLVEEVLSWMI